MKINDQQRRFMTALVELTHCNPFTPRRLELEEEALGDEFQAEDYVAWSFTPTEPEERFNIQRLIARAEELLAALQPQLATSAGLDKQWLTLYEGLVLYVLYHRHIRDPISVDADGSALVTEEEQLNASWRGFRRDVKRYLHAATYSFPDAADPAHLFATCCQIRRAFRHIFDFIVGDSLPAAQLRATVWQSIFTHDLKRYRRSLFGKMSDISTLISGPSGSGKELVARAIGLSQYVAFDATRGKFKANWRTSFLPINLSALSPTLIESELFGHCRGSFTGALGDRTGWLETCRSDGAVFLDEIGELDPTIQVKLLRVVQNREYIRLGETQTRRFQGKIISATNRDLAAELQAGRFREDFYYRLCSDRVVTPSLRDHLDDRPEGLGKLVRFITNRVAGDESECLATEVERTIQTQLGAEYAWPGNIRELEQCVRSVMLRQSYTPQTIAPPDTRSWLDAVERGELTLSELSSRYCTWIYARQGSYEQAAQCLGLDRRTVKARIDEDFLRTIGGPR